MNEEQALAICFTNLKGAKQKDILRTAKALQYLKRLPKYRTNDKVAAAVGVSREIVREFLTILQLPESVQPLFQRQLKLEHGRRLWQLSRKRHEAVEAAAIAMSDMNAMDARHLVDQLIRFPEMAVSDAKQSILTSKTVREDEYLLLTLLSEEQYKQLTRQASKRRVSPDKLATSIIADWLAGR